MFPPALEKDRADSSSVPSPFRRSDVTGSCRRPNGLRLPLIVEPVGRMQRDSRPQETLGPRCPSSGTSDHLGTASSEDGRYPFRCSGSRGYDPVRPVPAGVTRPGRAWRRCPSRFQLRHAGVSRNRVRSLTGGRYRPSVDRHTSLPLPNYSDRSARKGVVRPSDKPKAGCSWGLTGRTGGTGRTPPWPRSIPCGTSRVPA